MSRGAVGIAVPIALFFAWGTLGYLNADYFLGGKMRLNRDLAAYTEAAFAMLSLTTS